MKIKNWLCSLAALSLMVLLSSCCCNVSEHHEDNEVRWVMDDIQDDVLLINLVHGSTWNGADVVGHIYALSSIDDEPNRCVYVWPDQTWTLADETTPGFFDTDAVSGSLKEVSPGVWEAVGFPSGQLNNYTNLYTSGRIGAVINHRAIPSH